MVLISLFEGAGILLLIPLINLSGVLDVNSKSSSFLSWLSALFHYFPKTMSLTLILSIYVLLIVGQSYFQRKQTILNVKIQQGFIRHLREETYQSLLHLTGSFF
jgi:ATP-binding cassette subfamily C protein